MGDANNERFKKETLEEMVNRINTRNEQLEVKYAILAETFENLLDDIDNSALPRGTFYELRRDGRKLLNGEELT